MLKNRAFTLIELLVVIAIIAILAAILFPVFAQAKAAAKATAALSETKQLTLACIMYQNDFDDYFPLGTTWNTGSDPISFGAGLDCSPWSWTTAPYVKNSAILLDPTSGSTEDYFNLPTQVNNALFPHFGYNYAFLSPMGQGLGPSESSSQAANASNTVMLTSKWIHADQTDWANGEFEFVCGYPNCFPGGMMEDAAAESVECGALAQNCFSDWGQGDAWDAGGGIGGASGIPITDGRWTAGNAYRVSNDISIGWVDGHAKRINYGAASAGTNFNISAPAGSPGSNGNMTMVHAAQYPWSLTKDCSQLTYMEGSGCSL